jgi:predicted ATP-grasp superfamily ATP-dependent carboligase
MDFDTLVKALGAPFIIQPPLGSAGIGTYAAASASDLRNVVGLLPGGRILASSHAGGTTFNVHGIAISSEIEVSQPSVQLTGISELGNAPFGYCGNDFTLVKAFRESVVERSRQLTRSVGQWLLDEGYAGLYGVDLAVCDDIVTVLEVNPRLQGSTWLLATLEACRGRVPLVVKHFAHFFGGPFLPTNSRRSHRWRKRFCIRWPT